MPGIKTGTYENDECPDCGEAIPPKCEDGGDCANCGHVFHNATETDD